MKLHIIPKSVNRRHRQHGASAATLNIHVRNLAQTFNSLDPSPFWDRDLDREAAEFIEGEFSEKLSAGAWHLHVHTQEGAALASDLQAAVEHYYERLANSARHRLRDEMPVAQLALMGGLAIFLMSMTIRSALSSLLHASAPRALDEGLIIIAWLALWRPAESLIYGWVPLYRRRRVLPPARASRHRARRRLRETTAAGARGPSKPYGRRLGRRWRRRTLARRTIRAAALCGLILTACFTN
jgi:hypothetical protein